MKKRIKKIREIIAESDFDSLLIDSDVNRFYLTGFTGSAGRVLFTPENEYFITDFRYTEQAGEQTEGFEIIELNKDIVESINDILQRDGTKKLGFEAKTVNYYQYGQYEKKLKDIELISTEDLIKDIRMVKEENEIEMIKKAIEISDKAYEHILEFVEVGMTEKEVALELETYQKKLGGSKNAFDFIVASGKRSSMPHGVASDKVIQENDLITLDFGTFYKGYCSDITRTFVLGKASEKQKEVYNTVLKAQLAVIDQIKAGMSGVEADKIARDIIKEAGYGDNFGHGLGHGIGIEVHEGPSVSYKSEDTIIENSVVTDEPGIYIKDWGGVRIEDDLLITKDGCEVLNTAPKELIEVSV
ncbi:MAG: Xaa-Pro peptidase family protein [Halanaerobiales bacterium]|nr:Xaa-Pro peptidase family protein [Halanaerobiales bacterium]